MSRVVNSTGVARPSPTVAWATHLICLFTTIATLPLLISGGLVVSTESSLSVPDWPLSYGMWMPPMVGGIFYEHGHRMIGATVGLLVLILNAWVHLVDSRVWIRELARIALIAVCLQGLLGGLTVLYFLPLPVSVFHGCLAQIFFCLLLAMSLVTRTSGGSRDGMIAAPHSADGITIRKLTRALIATLAVQLVLGVTLRMNRPEVSVPLLVIHILWAFAVIGMVGWVSWKISTLKSALPRTRAIIYSIAGLVCLQFFLGLGALMARLHSLKAPQPTWAKILIPTAHQATGAVILGMAVALALLASFGWTTLEAKAGAPTPGTDPSKNAVTKPTAESSIQAAETHATSLTHDTPTPGSASASAKAGKR